ncbi:MAG: hypothetical protein JOZ51_23585 [Chloroflexi bacterium]|nr:hypothetical protein [Chloroflexota bacterium]
MRNKRFGKQTPRYIFALNPYQDVRFSTCPKCKRLNHLRKFPLLIHVDQFGLFALGKTCRYCTKCELIIAHQDELESVLAVMFAEQAPQVLGNEYFVIGTVERKVWKKGLDEHVALEDIRDHTADFKKYVTLEYQPARWVQADKQS